MTGALLTVPEVAELLRCNPETVRVMARRGDIGATRVGRGRTSGYRFTQQAIDRYLIAQGNRTYEKTR